MMRQFLTQLAAAYAPRRADIDVRGEDVVAMDGIQLLPLLAANSCGHLDSATVDTVRDGMRPAAILLLADM